MASYSITVTDNKAIMRLEFMGEEHVIELIESEDGHHQIDGCDFLSVLEEAGLDKIFLDTLRDVSDGMIGSNVDIDDILWLGNIDLMDCIDVMRTLNQIEGGEQRDVESTSSSGSGEGGSSPPVWGDNVVRFQDGTVASRLC